MTPLLGIAVVSAFMTVLFCALKLLEKLLHPHPELIRKLMHVGMGLAVLSFPWVFRQTWPVVLLAGASALVLTVIKFVPRLRDGIGTVLSAVHRPSLGEICFPISVASLIVLSRGDKLLYVVPILIMTLADAVAAGVGITYGRFRYITSDGFKSAEGSIAFLSIAFLSVHVPLLLFTDVGRPQTLAIAALIGILSMFVEAIAAHGLDNLLIPLGAFAFLRLYEHATVHALTSRLIVASALLLFVFPWRRRSTLDDSALIACALFGYGAAMLGGPQWLAGPTILFLVHAARWPRVGQHREHTVYAVVSITLAGFFWLILQSAYGGVARFLFPYAVGFGAHLAIIGVSRIANPHPASRTRPTQVVNSILAGAVLVIIQMIPFFILAGGTSVDQKVFVILAAFGGAGIAATTFNALSPTLYGPDGSDFAIHFVGFVTALLPSILVASIQPFFGMM